MADLSKYNDGTNEYNFKDATARASISTIEDKIPSAASSSNKLVDTTTLTTELNGKVNVSSVGANNGVAELDSNGRVPSSQLPSYVDDVLEYASQSAFPATGETGKIYIALDTNKTFRWSGSAYVEISESLALGETSSTAYAGNKGKANADAITAMKDGSSIDSFGDVETALAGKVDKVQGKGLSTNDYDNTAKAVVTTAQDNIKANTKLIKDTVGWSNKNNLLNNAVSTGIFTVNGDKSITINGTTSARTTLPLAVVDDNFHPNANNYILSLSETDENVELVIDAYNGSTWIKNIANTKTKANVTIDYDGYDRITAYLLINANVTISNKTVYPMLRDASILDSTYEPYRGTTAFPRDEQRVLGARNINATDYSKASALTNITATFNNDGTITANGTTTANESLAGGSAANFKAWYTGSVRIASAPENVLMTLYDATAGANVGTAGQTYNMTAGHDYRLSITFLANKTFTNVVVNPLIVLATDLDDTPAPYAMTNRELTEKVTPQIVAITTDANTLTKEGTYLYTSLITDAPTIHLPSEITNRYARIEVKTINGTSQLTQVLYTHNKTDFWTRALNNGTFTNWFKFSGTEVTP